MTYDWERGKKLKKILRKLFKKDKKQYLAVMSKIEEVITSETPHHYKNLQYDMKEFKRAHVGSFVLIFKVDDRRMMIKFEDYQHHDVTYRH